MTPYTQQLQEKTNQLNQLFKPFSAPTPQVYPSPEQYYRMRAEFRIWHNHDAISYAMFERGKKASGASLITLTQFPPASRSINKLMPILIKKINAIPILKNRWYQCEFLSTLSGEMLVTLIYHKKLDEHWEHAARALQDELGIAMIGRSRGQKVVLKQDFVTETLTVHGKPYHYRQIEGGFTQPNAHICQKMLAWACDMAQPLSGDLLELYCGNGNFTLPLAACFKRVLATEISKTSVHAAQWNLTANHIHNVQIARLSAEEWAEAWLQARPFRRLQEQNIDLKEYQFSTVLVDPPRAGIDAQTLNLLAHFPNIIYISCNPHSLAQNLGVLTQTHQVVSVALFDQFPFTEHIESGVFLQKRT